MQEVDGTRIPELKSIVSESLQLARKLGATQAEADVSLQKGLTTTVRLGEVETVEYQRDRGMGITVYFGKRKGSASTADLSPRAVAETVEKACDIARYTAEDECAGLADPEELARDIPDLDLDHPWDLPPEQAVETARECEAAGRAVDARITNSEGASVSSHRGVRVYGNSHGFLEGYPSTSHSVSCVLLAQAGDDMQRDYWYASARDARELESSESIGRKAGERAVARLGRAQDRDPEGARAVRAGSGARPHRAFPRRRARQQPVSQELVPARRCGPAGVSVVRRACANGRISARRSAAARSMAKASRRAIANWCSDGVLQGYVLGSYSARKLGSEDHRQCRRHAQPAGGIEDRRHGNRRADARARHRVVSHRAHGAGRERRHRRLLARRLGLLGGERRAGVSRARDHHRRQSQGHVQEHRGDRQ